MIGINDSTPLGDQVMIGEALKIKCLVTGLTTNGFAKTAKTGCVAPPAKFNGSHN